MGGVQPGAGRRARIGGADDAAQDAASGESRKRIEVSRNRNFEDGRSARGRSVGMADAKDHRVAAGAFRYVRRDMTRKHEEKAAFIAAVASAIESGAFVKLTLGKFRGQGEASKAVATLVTLKNGPHLKIVTSLARKDETKTLSINDGINHVKALIGDSYLSATLFATERDMTLTYSKKREPHLSTGKPTLKAARACRARSRQILSRCAGPALSQGLAGVGRGRPHQAVDAGQVSADLPLHRDRRRFAERSRCRRRKTLRFRSSISDRAKVI